MAEGGIVEGLLDDADLVVDGTDDPAHADMGPDDRDRFRVPQEEVPHLEDLPRLLVRLRERHVRVAVQERHQPDLAGEVEDPVQRLIREAGRPAGGLGRHELLVDRELADPHEDPGEGPEHPADVVRRVHVGGIEAGDHGIEPRLFLGRQGLVLHGDPGVGERVVVKGRVGLKVVGRGVIARVAVGPHLLQGQAEERGPADLVAHDLQELAGGRALLDVVGQVDVAVVEDIAGRPGRRGARRRSAPGPWRSGRPGHDEDQDARQRPASLCERIYGVHG